jgi:phosphoribosylanthranilate isomerase
MIRLKICGMKNPQNIKEVAALNPDYMGFIFYQDSKRYVDNLEPAILSELPQNISRVGVFVNHDLIEVVQIANRYSLNLLQLHGDESVEYLRALKQQLKGSNIQLIKAFGIDENFNFSSIDPYEELVEYFLFDTQTVGHGGSGKQFNWELLKNYLLNKPYFLSGGIGLERIEEIKKIDDKRLFAIDVNSRFEIQPGLKDCNKLKEFKNAI